METNLRPLLGTTDGDCPSPIFRRIAWQQFQRALDPLGAPRPLPGPNWAAPARKPDSATRAA